MNKSEASQVLLCADIGTSSLKAAFISLDGKIQAFVREAYPAQRVLYGKVLAEDWESAFLQGISHLMRMVQNLEIVALCLSGNGPTLVPVLADGTALPPLHWHEKRKTTLGDEKKGTENRPSLYLPHVHRFMDEDPDVYERAKLLISTQEWLSYRLGADPVTILPTPDYTPYYWDTVQCTAYGIDPAKFPPMTTLGQVIGEVSADAAARTKYLHQGIPIIAGGPDFIMALIGVGAMENGIVCDCAGTSEGINICSSKRSRSTELLTLPHVTEGKWNIAALLPTTGRLFEWFRNITGQQDRDYHAMLEEIVQAPGRAFTKAYPGTSSELKGGGFFFPDIRSAGKLTAASAILSTAGLTTQAELGRAVVEAIAFMVRGAIDTLERHGYRIEGMRLSGGQAKNPLWNQFKADITGRCLAVPEIEDGELAGDACLALTALGESTDLEDAIARIVRIKDVYEPNQQAYSIHSERYDAYKALLARMEKFFE